MQGHSRNGRRRAFLTELVGKLGNTMQDTTYTLTTDQASEIEKKLSSARKELRAISRILIDSTICSISEEYSATSLRDMVEEETVTKILRILEAEECIGMELEDTETCYPAYVIDMILKEFNIQRK